MNFRSGSTPSWKATVWVLVPCRYGWTPCLFASLSTGPMTNRLMKRARPARTWFGGTDVSPSAFRTIESTTKIFVKLVHISSRAGATDRTVSVSRMTIELDGSPSGPLTWTPTVAPPPVVLFAGPTGGVGAAGTAGATGAAEAGAPPRTRAIPSATSTARRRRYRPIIGGPSGRGGTARPATRAAGAARGRRAGPRRGRPAHARPPPAGGGAPG